MHFTRDPLIETIITPREGYKLVIRGSKGQGAEEYFVDSLQVVTIGQSSFYCCLEKPKAFLLPVADYEIVEARETRLTLKTPVALDKSVKIGGAKKEPELAIIEEVAAEQKTEKRRDRRRQRKKREKGASEQETTTIAGPSESKPLSDEKPSLIPPPTTLISETLARYRSGPLEETPAESPMELEATESEVREDSQPDESEAKS